MLSTTSFVQNFDIAIYNGWLIQNKSAVWQNVYTDSAITPEEIFLGMKH